MTTAHQPAEPVEPIDTREMVAVHALLRREFRLAGGVVRAVDVGDVARARVVGDHLDFLVAFLHRHHTGEDRLLWPKLLERVPDELAPIVRLMESQHRDVAALIDRIGELLPRWRATAAQEERNELAACFDDLHTRLVEHLDAEEERLLPIAARTVSLDEWRELGQEGVKATPLSQMPLTLGMLQYEGEPDVIAAMVREAPPLLRRFVPMLSRQAFRRHALAVHGTATP